MSESNQPVQKPTNQSGLPTEPEQVFSITWRNLSGLKPEWLEDEHILYKLKLFVSDVCDSGDPADASRVFSVVHDLLVKLPLLSQNRPDIFREYLRLLAVLKVSFIAVMPDADIYKFFREELVLAMEVEDFEVKDKLNELLSLYLKYPDAQANFAKELLRPIEENVEVLGTTWIELKGRDADASPKVSNWLIDYNQFVTSFTKPGAPLKRPGTIERVAYITQSENVRNLSEDERAILLRVLELYDWLRSFIPVTREISVGPTPYISARRLPSSPPLQKQVSKILPPPPPRPDRSEPQSPTVPSGQAGSRKQGAGRQSPPPQPSPPPSLPPQGGGIRGVERVPRTTALNEDLYRETLEELARQRAEAEKLIRQGSEGKPSTPPAPRLPLGAPSPRQERGIMKGQPMSVNEAIIQAGQKEPPADHGQVTAGEKDVEEKLKKLEDKLK